SSYKVDLCFQVTSPQTRAFQFISSLWICMILLHIPTFLAHTTKEEQRGPEDAPFIYCGINESSLRTLFISFFILGYIVPLFLIITLYFLILHYLQSHKPTSSEIQSRRHTARTCRIIVVVVVAFGISWLPHHVNSLYSLNHNLPLTEFYLVLMVI